MGKEEAFWRSVWRGTGDFSDLGWKHTDLVLSVVKINTKPPRWPTNKRKAIDEPSFDNVSHLTETIIPIIKNKQNQTTVLYQAKSLGRVVSSRTYCQGLGTFAVLAVVRGCCTGQHYAVHTHPQREEKVVAMVWKAGVKRLVYLNHWNAGAAFSNDSFAIKDCTIQLKRFCGLLDLSLGSPWMETDLWLEEPFPFAIKFWGIFLS